MVRIRYYSGYFWIWIAANFIEVICLWDMKKRKKNSMYGYCRNCGFSQENPLKKNTFFLNTVGCCMDIKASQYFPLES